MNLMNFGADERKIVKRILIVAGNYPPHIIGGGEIATRIMAEWFAGNGMTVHVVTCAEIENVKIENGITIEFVRSPNIYWRFAQPRRSIFEKAIWQTLDNYNPRTIKLLTRIIYKFKPDILVTSILENFGAAAWLAAKRSNVPVVDIIHGYYLQCIKASRFRSGNNCMSRCVACRLATTGKKYFSRYVDGVIGVSRHVLEAHISEGYFANGRKGYIYNPIEHLVEQPRAGYRSQVPTFGYLGKIQPTKGIEELVRIFSSGTVNCPLLIAGDGDPEFEAKLRAHADPKHIEFLGWVDPKLLFQRIDFLIFPSLWNEPFGRGIAEAMGQAIPVLGAKRGGIPELIEDGRNGYLYDPAVAGELERVVDLARAADYAALSRNALMASMSFSKSAIMKQYVEFFDAVVNERSCAKN
jgi:glycosyltransferase involved in cell wall biosynthesis